MSSDEEFQFIVRCAGTDVRGDWLVPFALTQIRGVGYRLARVLCDIAEINPSERIGYLTEDEIRHLEDIIKEPTRFNISPYLFNRRKDPKSGDNLHVHGSDLIIALKDDTDRLKKIRSYRGIRHALGLRVRGQRTRTTGRGGQTVGVTRRKKM